MELKKSVELITPEIAKKHLEKMHGEQRKIMVKHLYFLASEMRNKRWKFNGDPIRFDCRGNLIDGQHRLNAVIESGKCFEFVVIRGLPEDAIESIDQGARTRKPGDLLSMKGIVNPHNMASAVKVVIRIRNGKPTGPDPISAQTILREYYKCIGLEDSATWGNVKFMRKLIRPTYLVALHYLFSEINKEKADAFFQTIKTGEMLNGKRCAATVLRETLFRIKVNVVKKAVLSRYYELAIIIKAWNFYIDGIVPIRLSYDFNKEKGFPTIRQRQRRKKYPANVLFNGSINE